MTLLSRDFIVTDERGLSIESMAAAYRDFGERPRRTRPRRKRPAPAQELEDGDKLAGETPQPEVFDEEEGH